MNTPKDWHKAFDRRQALRSQGLEAYRLFYGFGEEPRCPLSIDRYKSVFVIRPAKPEAPVDEAAQALRSYEPGCPILIKRVHRGASLEQQAGQWLDAQGPVEMVVNEGPRRFQVELARTRNTGLFLDSRPAREHLQAHSQGLRVLNLYAYTGAFGVAAMLGGAASVVHVDNNERVLERARENYRLNGLEVDARDFVATSTEKALKYYRRRGDGFDCVVFDPPPAARRGRKAFRSKDHYFPLLRRVLERVAPGGRCYALCTDRRLQGEFEEHWQKLRGRLEGDFQILEQIRCGLDFPGDDGQPEARAWLLERA